MVFGEGGVMNRFHKAWLALTGRLEPEVREVEVAVFGEPHLAELYVVNVPDEGGDYIESMDGRRWYKSNIPTYYTTCEQAHSSHPGLSVSEVRAVRIGQHYFIGSLMAVNPQPKPKRPKGTRA